MAANDREVILVRDDHHDPKPGHTYIVTADPSIGTDDGRPATGRDPNAVAVWDASMRPWPLVACYHGYRTNDGQKAICKSFSRHYANASVWVEENKGLLLITSLLHDGVNVGFQGMVEGFLGRNRTRHGWYSSTRTRERATKLLRTALANHEMEIFDPDMLRECMTYILARSLKGDEIIQKSERAMDNRADVAVIAADVLNALRIEEIRDESRPLPTSDTIASVAPPELVDVILSRMQDRDSHEGAFDYPDHTSRWSHL